jgi:dethiobiotin synthetase
MGAPSSAAPLRLAVVGTDTGVGKTRVTALLVRGLRAQGRRVWVHKPVACGGWDGTSADDGRALAALCGDGQDPATVCPYQFPEAASPHLAAAAAGVELRAPDLFAPLGRLCHGHHDLVVEGAGGLATPLSTDRRHLGECLRELNAGLGRPPRPCHPFNLVLVARAGLGTLNHTALTAAMAHGCGLAILGVVVNHVDPGPESGSLAVRTAARELAISAGAPVLAELPYDPGHAQATAQAMNLAAAVLALSPERPEPIAGSDV